MVLQFSPSSGVCKMLCEFSEGCVKHKIIQWIENRRVASACCLLMRLDFTHRVRALEVKVHAYTETDEMLWPCLVGLQREPRQPSHACFASAVVLLLQGRCALAWHFDELIAAVPYTGKTAILQSVHKQDSGETKRRDKQREREKWSEMKLNEMDPTVLDYVKYPSVCMFPFCRKTWSTNTLTFTVGEWRSIMMASLFVDEDKPLNPYVHTPE